MKGIFNFYSGMLPFSDKLESAFDLKTYVNRVKHFTLLTNPATIFIPNSKLK